MLYFRRMSMAIVDAYAPMVDPRTQALSHLVATLAEDAIFGLSCGGGAGVLEMLARRRGEAYQAVLAGHRLNTMSGEIDPWLVEMVRAIVPIHPPVWMPMADVLREKVTLEVGARGLRSFFSSKPSDKDVLRVKRLGALATRVLRAVFAADGPIDPEEQRTLASLVAALGLPDEDAQPLYAEPPLDVRQLDVYGDVEAGFAKALLRGAWLAAAADGIDPREEHVVRVVANKLNTPAMDLEVIRNDVVQRIDVRRTFGQAVVDAIRYVLSDRVPGHGVTLAAKAGQIVLPRRYRDEVMAQIGHGAKVTLAKRYAALPGDDKEAVLSMAWAAALYEDPSVARRALLRARHDRVALDLGEDGAKPRAVVEQWIGDVLAPAAYPMGGE
jgi:tellurite resistance protein